MNEWTVQPPWTSSSLEQRVPTQPAGWKVTPAWHHPVQPQPAHTTGLCRKSLPRGRSSSEASGTAVLSPAPSSSGHRLGAVSGVCRWHSLKQVSDWMSWQHFHISSCQLCSIQLHFLQVCWTCFPEQAHPCLASTRLQSITLHFEDKEGRTLELYLTGEGRLAAGCTLQSVSWQQAGGGLDQMGQLTSYQLQPLPDNTLQAQGRVSTATSKGLSKLSKLPTWCARPGSL